MSKERPSTLDGADLATMAMILMLLNGFPLLASPWEWPVEKILYVAFCVFCMDTIIVAIFVRWLIVQNINRNLATTSTRKTLREFIAQCMFVLAIACPIFVITRIILDHILIAFVFSLANAIVIGDLITRFRKSRVANGA